MSLSGRLHDYGEGNINGKDRGDSNIYWGVVVTDASQDPSGAGRVRVRIRGLDRDIRRNDDLPWVNPLLPKFFNVSPKIGETVKVITLDRKNTRINRFFIGPVISQPNKFEFDPHFFSSRAGMDQGLLEYGKPWFKDPESKIEDTNWTILCESRDIALNGRRNQDLILRNGDKYDEVIMRVGKSDPNRFTKLNKKNPGYISLVFQQKNGEYVPENRSHVNIVSDSINLISHQGSHKGKPEPILNSDDPQKQILTERNKLSPLVYGDKFWEFVDLMEKFVRGHIHDGGGVAATPPDLSGPTKDLLDWLSVNKGRGGIADGAQFKPNASNPDGSEYTEYDSPLLSKGVKTN